MLLASLQLHLQPFELLLECAEHDVCAWICVEMNVEMFVGMCVGMCVDMSVEMCVEICRPLTLFSSVLGMAMSADLGIPGVDICD